MMLKKKFIPLLVSDFRKSVWSVSSISVAVFGTGRWYYSLPTGPPRQARLARFGPCPDFGFQYVLIRNKRSKKILGRILDLAWLKFAVAALAYTIRNKSSKTKVFCVKKKVCYKYEKNSGSCLGVTGLDWLCYFAGKS